MNKRLISRVLTLGIIFAVAGTAYAAAASTASGKNLAWVAHTVISNFSELTKLLTAGSFVAGFAFVIGAIVKFKAHKDNPTQIPIGTPIALLFVGAALVTIPTVVLVGGGTIFGGSGVVSTTSGVYSMSGKQ